jgi:hypothetical protein
MAEPNRPARGRRSSVPARFWTVPEANARLEGLRELLPQLKAWVVRLTKVHDELERLARFWAHEVDSLDNPDRELKLRLDDEWKRLGQRLEAELLELQGEGIELKDLETGLVDFYSKRGGETVFLCWQRGESEVGHWHPLTGNYRTRRPIEGRKNGPAAPGTARAERGV